MGFYREIIPFYGLNSDPVGVCFSWASAGEGKMVGLNPIGESL